MPCLCLLRHFSDRRARVGCLADGANNLIFFTVVVHLRIIEPMNPTQPMGSNEPINGSRNAMANSAIGIISTIWFSHISLSIWVSDVSYLTVKCLSHSDFSGPERIVVIMQREQRFLKH
jgi:hypothetical protein